MDSASVQRAVSAMIEKDRTRRGTWVPAPDLEDKDPYRCAFKTHLEGIIYRRKVRIKEEVNF